MVTRSRLGAACALVLGVVAIWGCGASPPTPAVTVTATPVVLPDTSAAQESAVKEGIHSLQVAVQSYAVDHKDKYPPAGLVSEAGMAPYVETWPTNPYTNAPMAPGQSPGDYNYGVSPKRTQFKLVGYGASGPIIVVP